MYSLDLFQVSMFFLALYDLSRHCGVIICSRSIVRNLAASAATRHASTAWSASAAAAD